MQIFTFAQGKVIKMYRFSSEVTKYIYIGIAIYIVSVFCAWLVISVSIFCNNRSAERNIERRPIMKAYYRPYKYIPLSKFYAWPVDMIKEMKEQARDGKDAD